MLPLSAPNVGRLPSPLGELVIAWSDRGLHAAAFADDDPRAPQDRGASVADSAFANAFAAYFAGRTDALADLEIVLEGTPFQCRVWQALKSIPAGSTRTYGEVAEAIGRAGASRAVGSANGRNRLCIVVPCHRVVAAGGKLGGYSAGLDRKRWLLRHEGQQAGED